MFRTKHFTLISNSAKHFPQFICREKYIFDNTKSDASTDFVMINLFHDIYSNKIINFFIKPHLYHL